MTDDRDRETRPRRALLRIVPPAPPVPTPETRWWAAQLIRETPCAPSFARLLVSTGAWIFAAFAALVWVLL